MKIAVLGAGVIGITTAWYLARACHEVEVIERQPGAALETSFANAGEISPGYASPWAAPGVPMKALKWLAMRHAPLILNPGCDMATWRWMAKMLGECNARSYARNKARMVRVAEYSRDCLEALRHDTGIAFDERQNGTLQVFRTQAQLDALGKDTDVLASYGVPFEVLDRAGCIAAEPGLAHASAPIAGGLRLPHDETGDCFKFTQSLAERAQETGVTLRYGVGIQALESDGRRITGLRTDQGLIAADAFVVALGSFSPALLRPLGIDLPVYPVKGYSITVPVASDAAAPQSTVMDETFKVAITRLGDRIRVGGIAELSGFNRDLRPRARDTLHLSLGEMFPGATLPGSDRAGTDNFWTGMRPMTPDGTPVIGVTGLDNLYLNTGHGTLGWTMACGSARVLADVISGRQPEIEHGDLAIARYGRAA
ncbi:MAG: D-amino acid dehydrogenase [Sphingomonadales bacterium]|nr:D-amino acid dehydrogenase [Sphingomonadales bacterium]MDE2170608.1 D-amino acid dehydrogenase [Sphingomonadales bacterium]